MSCTRKEFTCSTNCNKRPKQHKSRMYKDGCQGNSDYAANQIYRLANTGYCQSGATNVCDSAQPFDINSVKPYGANPKATFTNTHHHAHEYLMTFPAKRYKKYNNTLVYTNLMG